MNAMNEKSPTRAADPVSVLIGSTVATSAGSVALNGLKGKDQNSMEGYRQTNPNLSAQYPAAEAQTATPVAGGKCTHGRVEFRDGLELKVSAITGAKYLDTPPKRRGEIDPKKYPVAGLRIFDQGAEIRFEFIAKECLDKSDCIDAQCRAGWDDYGHGFYGLQVLILPDGAHRATWACGASLD